MKPLLRVFLLLAACVTANAQPFLTRYENLHVLLFQGEKPTHEGAVLLEGLINRFDGSGGIYLWAPGDTSATNSDLSVVAIPGVASGRWFRAYKPTGGGGGDTLWTNLPMPLDYTVALSNPTNFVHIGPDPSQFNQTPFGDNVPATNDLPHFIGQMDLPDDDFTAALTVVPQSTHDFADVEGIDIGTIYTGNAGNGVGLTAGVYYIGGTNQANDLLGVQGILNIMSGSVAPYGEAVRSAIVVHSTNAFPALWNFHATKPVNDGGGTWTQGVAYYSDDRGGVSGILNSYYSWFDSRGVRRVKEDNTFDSVGQAIEALYNPQFTKYTAGATNFERVILGQWNGNVAEIGTEKGGSGTSRDLRLIGPHVEVQNNLRIDSTTSTPTGAQIGAGKGIFWISNAVAYVSVSTDGSSVTTKQIAP